MININIAQSNKYNVGENSLYMKFDYDTKIVNVIKALPIRYWDADNKTWEVPVKYLPEIIKNLGDFDMEITGEYICLDKKENAKKPTNFEFKTKPYEHQIVAFNFGLNNNRWLLGDEMGLGKTKTVIDIAVAKKAQHNYKHCLIICGVNGLKWNWKNEVATHSNETAWILGQRMTGNKWTVGGNKEKLADLNDIRLIDSYFIITNIETLRNAEILEKLIGFCKDGTIGVIALDEAHRAKNPQSQQGKGLLKLQAENMIAMTGTPLMNTPLDLFIILKWLGYEKHAFYSFKNHYCTMGGYGNYQIVGYKHLDELQARLDDIMLRRKKEEVLDLPEKVYIDEIVEMTAKQEQIYKEITAEIKMNIDQIKMANNPLAELIRMRQATGYTGILSSSIKESAKLDRLEELVEDAISNGKKVVIFSNWTQMTLPIYNRLAGKYSGTYITGEIDDEQRNANVKRFQEDDNCKFVVGTTGAMGTGLTLTAGTVEIFMDEPWNKATKEQCVDRCHRIGQKNNITVYTIMCEGTIDERIHEIVEKKGLMADALVDGKIAMNSREMLEYLIG